MRRMWNRIFIMSTIKAIFVEYAGEVSDDDWALILRYIKNKIGVDKVLRLDSTGHK